MKRFLVTVMRTPSFDAGLIDAHRHFLDDLREAGCLELAGGFTDQTGGAYVLLAEDLEKAKTLAFEDPLHLSHASTVSVHEWATG